MEYLTDTILCKALFAIAFIAGLVIGVTIKDHQ